MVSAARVDSILRREIPFHRASIRRREYFRQRLLRDRRTIPYRLFLDRDSIPNEITQAVSNHEDVPHELLFAPLPPEVNAERSRPLPEIRAREDQEEEEEKSDTCSVSSTATTIVINLDNHTTGIPPGLLRAWESNAGIRRDQQIQTSPSRPDSPLSEYSGPSYSPVRPEESDSFPGYSPPNYSPVPFGRIDDSVDYEVNQFLDYLNSEEFLNSIVES